MRIYLRVVKTTAHILIVLMFTISCLVQPVFAFDFDIDLDINIRGFFQKRVQACDQFIQSINTKADSFVDRVSGSASFFTRQGFSTLETFTGLSEENELYRYSKNNWLKTIGFGLGAFEGTKDLATGTVSLLAYLDSSPARAINLAYNLQERPQEYKEKAISAGKTVTGIIANPLPLLNGIYQFGKNTYMEVQKDPLKKGKLQGEIAVFGASLLLGAGQVRTVAAAGTATKSINTAKSVNTAKSIITAKSIHTAKSINPVKVGGLFAAPTAQIGLLTKASAQISALTEKVSIRFEELFMQIPTFEGVLLRPVPAVTAGTSGKSALKSMQIGMKNLAVPRSVQANQLPAGNGRGTITFKDLNEGLLGNSLRYTYKVGDEIDGAKITGINGNMLTLADRRILYQNTINEDVPQLSRFVKFEQQQGVWKADGEVADGVYTFVITKDMRLLVTSRKFNHSWLTGGEPVRYAGELTFKEGKFLNWNNRSGHYLPDPADAINVRPIIEDTFKTADSFMAIDLSKIRETLVKTIKAQDEEDFLL
ncbi:MAG: hypothetical protein ACOX2X_06780 [Peptococcia bacterium]